MTGANGMHCAHCGAPFEARFVALERRTERLEFATGSDGHTGTILHVLACDTWPRWCAWPCWLAEADAVVRSLDITHPFPATGATSPCGRCGRAVDRTRPHVALNASETRLHEQPWLTTGEVLEETTVAVFCAECVEPHEEAEREASIEPHELARA